MKRYIALFLTLALLLSGCGNRAPAAAAPATTEAVQTPMEQTAEPAVQKRSKVVIASSMDEFLAAIGPDTEVFLQEGTFNLADASDYGQLDRGNNPYYRWMNCYDGYELHITDVSGLSIRGSGRDITNMETAPRFANVLTFENCRDVELADVTVGHTIAEPGECSGGVSFFNSCEDVLISGCGLFGCGTNGVQTRFCDRVRVEDTDIYHCTISGMIVDSSRQVEVENCRFYELGQEPYGGYAVISVNDSKGLDLTNCEFRENNTSSFLTAYNSIRISASENKFTGNNFKNNVLDLQDSSGGFFNNSFENNRIRRWYSTMSNLAQSSEGEILTEQDFVNSFGSVMTGAPESSAQRKEVHVSTVDEFLNAIGSETEIVLDKAMYDLSTASGYGTQNGEHYEWVDNFDGPALVITGIHDLTIRSNDGKTKNHTIAAIPRYADVLFFRECDNISLSGFTAGHTKEPGSCMGGVLKFSECSGISVDHCGLFGCGILGIQAEYCTAIQVSDCEIYECSYGGVNIWDSNDISFEHCIFRDLGGPRMHFNGCVNITEDGKVLENGTYD